jgi:ketosteroid isomerase-like protein
VASTFQCPLRYAAAFTLIFAAACDSSRSGDAADTARLLSSLRAADSSLQAAVAARDAERTAAFYAEDAVLMPVAEPIVEGRLAILEEWRHVYGIPGFTSSSHLVAASLSTAGDLGYTRGTYESGMQGTGGRAVVERGKWVSVWKRGTDGSWRIIVDISNTDAPPPDHQPSTAITSGQ